MGGPGGALGSFLHMGCCLISWHLVLELQTNHPCALQAGDGSGGGGTWQVWCEGTAWGSDLLSSLSYSALSRAGFYALCCHWMTTGCCLRTRQSLHPARTCRHPPLHLQPSSTQQGGGQLLSPPHNLVWGHSCRVLLAPLGPATSSSPVPSPPSCCVCSLFFKILFLFQYLGDFNHGSEKRNKPTTFSGCPMTVNYLNIYLPLE